MARKRPASSNRKDKAASRGGAAPFDGSLIDGGARGRSDRDGPRDRSEGAREPRGIARGANPVDAHQDGDRVAAARQAGQWSGRRRGVRRHHRRQPRLPDGPHRRARVDPRRARCDAEDLQRTTADSSRARTSGRTSTSLRGCRPGPSARWCRPTRRAKSRRPSPCPRLRRCDAAGQADAAGRRRLVKAPDRRRPLRHGHRGRSTRSGRISGSSRSFRPPSPLSRPTRRARRSRRRAPSIVWAVVDSGIDASTSALHPA